MTRPRDRQNDAPPGSRPTILHGSATGQSRASCARTGDGSGPFAERGAKQSSTRLSRPVRTRWESRWSGSPDLMPVNPGAPSGGRVMDPGPVADSNSEVDATGNASAGLGDEATSTLTRDDILTELRASAAQLDPAHAGVYATMDIDRWRGAADLASNLLLAHCRYQRRRRGGRRAHSAAVHALLDRTNQT